MYTVLYVFGLFVQKIDSQTDAPGSTYADALYHSADTFNISTLLWQDPTLAGWACRTSYRWTVEHSPSIGLIRFVKNNPSIQLIRSFANFFSITINL